MDCLRSPTAQRKPGSSGRPRGPSEPSGLGAPSRASARRKVSSTWGTLGPWNSVGGGRAEARRPARREGGVGRREVRGAEEQLGEVRGPCLVERGPLAARELHEEATPGLLVRSGEHQRRGAEGRSPAGER